MKLRFFVCIIQCFIIGSEPIKSQSTTLEEALSLFEKENYTQALPLFRQLVTLFPKEPRYQYYTGVCLVQSNTNLKEAVNYLTKAASGDVPGDVYYFLGKANHLQYKFDEALDAYMKFQQFGKKKWKDRWQCDLNIDMARNGKRLLTKQSVFEVYKVDTIHMADIFDFYNSFLHRGKFIKKTEKRIFLNDPSSRDTWRFIPNSTDTNHLVIESVLTGTFHKNKDLGVITRIADNNWSRPALLGNNINSPYDEEYGYFNVEESALYFSSKGHGSMGGYDIFKSIYDPQKKLWGPPINLGYPINTPYDDYLFIPSDDQSLARFCSNRETHDQQIRVYTISFSHNYETIDLSPQTDYTVKSILRPVNVKRIGPVISTKRFNPVGISLKPASNEYPSELLNHRDYNGLINLAMKYQLQSDSMGRAEVVLRQRLPVTKTETEKVQIRKEISSLEIHSKESQKKADENYDKARAIEKFYTGKNQSSDSNNQNSNNQAKEAIVHRSSSENNNVVNEFKIIDPSPYASIDQIPVNQPVREGLFYRIQLGVFSRTVDVKRFKGIVPVNGETIQDGTTKYFAGLFNRLALAEKALNKIHSLGLQDAYIVSYYNGTKISINRAKELEKDKP